jgi:hypothetical protein
VEDKKGKFRPTSDELRLSMQPPRPSSKGVATMQNNIVRGSEVAARGSGKQDRSKTPLNVAGPAPGRLSLMGLSSERPSGQLSLENSLGRESFGLSPIIAPPAADEGSRTGIKGSVLLSSLQQAAAPSSQVPGLSGASPSPRRPKVSTHGPGSDTAQPSSRYRTL